MGQQEICFGKINVLNPAISHTIEIERIEPTVAKRTLGAIIALSGRGKDEMKHTVGQAHEYVSKIKPSKLSQSAKLKSFNNHPTTKSTIISHGLPMPPTRL